MKLTIRFLALLILGSLSLPGQFATVEVEPNGEELIWVVNDTAEDLYAAFACYPHERFGLTLIAAFNRTIKAGDRFLAMRRTTRDQTWMDPRGGDPMLCAVVRDSKVEIATPELLQKIRDYHTLHSEDEPLPESVSARVMAPAPPHDRRRSERILPLLEEARITGYPFEVRRPGRKAKQ